MAVESLSQVPIASFNFLSVLGTHLLHSMPSFSVLLGTRVTSMNGWMNKWIVQLCCWLYEFCFIRHCMNVYVCVHMCVDCVCWIGLLTGVVVDSGDGVTHICPVYDGYSQPCLTKRLDIAGRDITRHLIKVDFFYRIVSVLLFNSDVSWQMCM